MGKQKQHGLHVKDVAEKVLTQRFLFFSFPFNKTLFLCGLIMFSFIFSLCFEVFTPARSEGTTSSC